MKKVITVASVVMMLIFSSVSVMAASSATGTSYYKLTIGTSSSATTVDVDGGTITVSANPVVVGEEVTLTASAADGYVFTEWAIEGDYDVVSDDGETITIIPNGDLVIDAVFESEEESEDEETTSDDTSDTSPTTGQSAAAVMVVLVAACVALAVARKRISE